MSRKSTEGSGNPSPTAPDPLPDPPPKKQPSGPVRVTIRRRTAGGGWERCSLYDPASSRRLDAFPRSVCGANYEQIPAQWGGGEYEITERRGRHIVGQRKLAWEGEARPAYTGPPPQPEQMPAPAAASRPDEAYRSGFEAGQRLMSEAMAMVIATLRETAKMQEAEAEGRLKRARLDADERHRALRADNEAAMRTLIEIHRAAKSTEKEDALAAQVAELAERVESSPDPEAWRPLVESVTGAISESVGPILQAVLAAKLGPDKLPPGGASG